MQPSGEPLIELGEVTVDERDVEALRGIDEYGSMHRAAEELGRSYARINQRISTLEDSVGTLVTRTRGGPDGGGSTLTERAHDLLARYDRLTAEFSGLARAQESVFRGTVVDRDGMLGTIETDAGTIRGIVSGESDTVQVSVRSDAVGLVAPDEAPRATQTSVRNQFSGTVLDVESRDGLVRVTLDVGAETPLRTLVTERSREELDLTEGTDVVASFKATATRAVPEP
ncbi:MAG: molybdenum-dependent transcriptional regulator [Halobaculum sp.]